MRQGDSARALALARRCNEFSAELVHARPDRLGGFACLPLPDVDASLEELSYALDVEMHYMNRFARTPKVKYIFSDAGGSIPYLAARFAIIDEMGFIAGQRGAAADMFRRIYWDTALAASDPVLPMLLDVAGINRVLYGTDFPYLRRDMAVSSKQRILLSVCPAVLLSAGESPARPTGYGR
jgi:predicted TIM-barrel fold metal-dependent hydrolase